jgi:hypothetical protein
LAVGPGGAVDEGQLLVQDGAIVPVAGQIIGRAISLVFALPDGTVLFGTGVSQVPMRGAVGGTFSSSVEGEGGDWAGVSGDSVSIGSTLYFPDTSQHVVYQKPLDGSGSVFAGAVSTPGFIDGPRRTTARLNGPQNVSTNKPGAAIWLAEPTNQAIRKITLATNAVSTVLGRSQAVAAVPTITTWGAAGVAVDDANNLFITDQTNHVIWFYNASNNRLRVLAGAPGVAGRVDGVGSAARFYRPTGASLSNDQLLLNVVDSGNMLLRQVARDGRVVTLGGVAPG